VKCLLHLSQIEVYNWMLFSAWIILLSHFSSRLSKHIMIRIRCTENMWTHEALEFLFMSGKCAFVHDKKYGDEFGTRSLSF
jgi:hypothetical protein